MSKISIPALVILLLLGPLAYLPSRSSAAWLPSNPASASELLQLVNQLRAANGLPAYKANSALMAAAQAHSDYQAETRSTSHTGQGGSRPRDRAVAWGYGGGAAVYVSENIATGTNLTASEAVGWWQGDSIHLNTMLLSKYRDAGAGVAESDGTVYFTLDVGYIAGDEGQPPDSPPQQGANPGSTPAAPAGTPRPVVIPVQAATPRPDGSIVHVVQEGQAPASIAAVYGISLPYLLTLNGLSENSLIFPGDKLQIRPPDATLTPVNSPPVQAPDTTPAQAGVNPTPPRSSATPSSPAAAALAQAPALASSTPAAQTKAGIGPAQSEPRNSSRAGNQALDSRPAREGIDPLLAMIAGLVVVGTALLVLGSLVRRRV